MNPVDPPVSACHMGPCRRYHWRDWLDHPGNRSWFLLVFGGVFHFWMQWIRHQSWVQNQVKLGAPSMHHFWLLGALVMVITFLAALVWVLVQIPSQ